MDLSHSLSRSLSPLSHSHSHSLSCTTLYQVKSTRRMKKRRILLHLWHNCWGFFNEVPRFIAYGWMGVLSFGIFVFSVFFYCFFYLFFIVWLRGYLQREPGGYVSIGFVMESDGIISRSFGIGSFAFYFQKNHSGSL